MLLLEFFLLKQQFVEAFEKREQGMKTASYQFLINLFAVKYTSLLLLLLSRLSTPTQCYISTHNAVDSPDDMRLWSSAFETSVIKFFLLFSHKISRKLFSLPATSLPCSFSMAYCSSCCSAMENREQYKQELKPGAHNSNPLKRLSLMGVLTFRIRNKIKGSNTERVKEINWNCMVRWRKRNVFLTW